MGLIKTATVVSDDVREKINNDLKEGNFDVVENTRERHDPYMMSEYDPFGRLDWDIMRETVILRLHSGYVLTIEEG